MIKKKKVQGTRDGLEPLPCLSWSMVMVVGGRSLSSGPEHNVHNKIVSEKRREIKNVPDPRDATTHLRHSHGSQR